MKRRLSFLLNFSLCHGGTRSFKAFGLDKLDPYFLKLVQDFIVEPLTDIYNLTPMNNKIPDIWKNSFKYIILISYIQIFFLRI